MSAKNTKTTSDYIPWDTAMLLIHRLYRDGNYRMSLLVGCGCFFGLRISDLLQLTWSMLLDANQFTVIEKKTKKFREVRINKNFQQHIKDCYEALGLQDPEEKCFLSHKKRVYSVQRINVLLKDMKVKYGLKDIDHLSTHSLRKTFGRRVYETSGNNGEMALIMLSELFNHSNIAITKRYLGLRKQEIMGCYDLLEF